MHIKRLTIPDVLLIVPETYRDSRGFFMESWNDNWNTKLSEYNLNLKFIQDNHSHSKQNVLRGLHYQVNKPQGKLVRALNGTIFDVAVDLRLSSPYYGQWVAAYLSEDNHYMLWVPPGFAHGFYVQSKFADVMYKVTEEYSPKDERCIIWNDLSIAIHWPLVGARDPILNNKDHLGKDLAHSEVYL